MLKTLNITNPDADQRAEKGNSGDRDVHVAGGGRRWVQGVRGWSCMEYMRWVVGTQVRVGVRMRIGIW